MFHSFESRNCALYQENLKPPYLSAIVTENATLAVCITIDFSEVRVEKSWKAAIKKVLAESETPMHYTEISEKILTRGYYETDGATPAATVNAQLASSIKHDGDKSPFMRVSKGVFALKNSPAEAIFSVSTPILKGNKLKTLDDSEVELSDSIIHSFGMYWQRDLVVWRNDQ